MIGLDLLKHIQEAVVQYIQRSKLVISHFTSFSVEEKGSIVECTGVFKDINGWLYSYKVILDGQSYRHIDTHVASYEPQPTVEELISKGVKKANDEAHCILVQADRLSTIATRKILNAGLYGVSLGWICSVILQLIELLTGINNLLLIKNILDFFVIVVIVIIYRYILLKVCSDISISIPNKQSKGDNI